jgi:hypothetical protein
VNIVLDANIICADLPLQGIAFRVFLGGLPRTGAACHVPAVVVDEVLAKYRRELIDARKKLEQANRGWRHLTESELCPEITDAAITRETEAYRQRLQRRFADAGIAILPYPSVPHEDLVRRAVERRKPFRESGTGYRDALIWESALALFARDSSPLLLVTDNAHDFGEGPVPHPDLVADLTARSLPETGVRVVRSLQDLNSELILPRLRQLDELASQIRASTCETFSLREWIDRELQALLEYSDWDTALVGLDPGSATVGIGGLSPRGAPVVDDLRLLPNGDMVLAANADMSGDVTVFATARQLRGHSEIRDFLGDEGHGDATAWLPVHANVAFTLILRADTLEVQSADVDEVDGDFGCVSANPHPRTRKRAAG